MKEECYSALEILIEEELKRLYQERRQTRDLGEKDRITGKIQELQKILEVLREKKKEK